MLKKIHKNIKKLSSKVPYIITHSEIFSSQPANNQSKSHNLLQKNGSLRGLQIMFLDQIMQIIVTLEKSTLKFRSLYLVGVWKISIQFWYESKSMILKFGHFLHASKMKEPDF